MYNDLKQCLLLYVNENVAHNYLEAYRILNEIGLSDQDTELLNIMSLDGEASDGALLVGRIEACLTYAVGDQLSQYGITMMEGTPLPVMTSVLEATATFENYHIPEAVRDILLTDEFDDDEKFAEFVSLFSDLEPIDVTFHMESIRATTLERIKTTVEDEIAIIQPPSEPIPKMRERSRLINHIERTVTDKHLMVVRKVADSGFQMGVDHDIVLEDVVAILDGITGNDEQLALEILALSVYTDEDYTASFLEFVDDYANSEYLKTSLARIGLSFLKNQGYSDAKA